MWSVLCVVTCLSGAIRQEGSFPSLPIRGNGLARIDFVTELCPFGVGSELRSDIDKYDVSSRCKSYATPRTNITLHAGDD